MDPTAQDATERPGAPSHGTPPAPLDAESLRDIATVCRRSPRGTPNIDIEILWAVTVAAGYLAPHCRTEQGVHEIDHSHGLGPSRDWRWWNDTEGPAYTRSLDAGSALCAANGLAWSRSFTGGIAVIDPASGETFDEPFGTPELSLGANAVIALLAQMERNP